MNTLQIHPIAPCSLIQRADASRIAHPSSSLSMFGAQQT
jgi:hypothetical protein